MADRGIIAKSSLKNGAVLAELTGFGGEDDFYRAYALMEQIVRPDTSRTNVDSLCVMGTFKKDGLSFRMSSEGVNDWISIQYGPFDEDGMARVESWVEALAEQL